ncbi:hypothetical protein ACN38_g9037 [Penicillium nordicum]|uniref:Uncharacterized protein n=1 Tax=Penicillium nordicum TaxID=229535 RepID=A0A0M8P2R2_9EURO|nr:hypothetical protein ACN38_g9037 [Penicillium nordicum]
MPRSVGIKQTFINSSVCRASVCFFGVSDTVRLPESSAKFRLHTWLRVLPLQANVFASAIIRGNRSWGIHLTRGTLICQSLLLQFALLFYQNQREDNPSLDDGPRRCSYSIYILGRLNP